MSLATSTEQLDQDNTICRIAYVIDTISCDTSGTERQLLDTIQRLDRQRFSPHLICLHDSDWLQGHQLPCPCTILGYKGLMKTSLFGVLRRLRRVLIEQHIQLVQTFFEDSIFVAWLATCCYRQRIVLLSSRRDMGLGAGNQPWYHKVFALALPFVNRSFDGIIANSRQIRAYVAQREKTSTEKIEVIYNGVKLPMATGPEPKIFHTFPHSAWIVIVASLSPVKRHDLLIRAMGLLQQKPAKQTIRVLVLGTGSEKERLHALAEKENVLDCFHFVGAVADVSAYLPYVDIGVLCSDREGLSNAILEYMAAGLPVVATAVGGNVELVDDENGQCVPVDNHRALAEALFALLSDPQKRRQLGANSRRKVEESFSWQRSMNHLQDYYTKKLRQKGICCDR